MWEAFQEWCADRGLNIAVSHAMFGRLARWQKGRIGGAVWYLDCELAEGYVVHEPKAPPAAPAHCRPSGSPSSRPTRYGGQLDVNQSCFSKGLINIG